jgi:hypothetical protein
LFICSGHLEGCNFKGDITAIKDHVNCYNCPYLYKPCFNCNQLYRLPRYPDMERFMECPDCKLVKRDYEINSPEHKLECIKRVKELSKKAMEEQKEYYESIIADLKLNNTK